MFVPVCWKWEIPAECAAEGWVGKITAEEVTASPLPMKADVELTPGSYQMKESVYGLSWSAMGWARSCSGEANSVPGLHSTRLGLVLFCELENYVIQA